MRTWDEFDGKEGHGLYDAICTILVFLGLGLIVFTGIFLVYILVVVVSVL